MSNSNIQASSLPEAKFVSTASDRAASAYLLPQDEELSQILDEVKELSKIAESHAPDNYVLTQTLRRAVSCVARQSLLERELRSLALFDDLTGLHNRRAFSTLAAQEFRIANRNQQSFLLFFADIDGLKQINDSHGHGEGDLAIIRIAHALQQTFRNSDIVARWGGDEFGVIALEASSPEDEAGILSRLTASLRTLNADCPRYDLALSVGSARYNPAHPVSLHELMEQADRSMYKNKRGRSHLEIASLHAR